MVIVLLCTIVLQGACNVSVVLAKVSSSPLRGVTYSSLSTKSSISVESFKLCLLYCCSVLCSFFVICVDSHSERFVGLNDSQDSVEE